MVDGFFCRFGMPNELHSDQGSNFESALFRECCQLLGIRKTRTTPLHPESDGMVERFNRTLVQEMAKRCRHGQTDWDQHIPTILMAYRSAEHEATGYTPAQLMIGRDLRLPLDLLIERPPDDQDECTTSEFVRRQRDRMCTVRAQVEGNLKISADTMKQRKDIKATVESLGEDDQVWLYNPKRKKGQSPKLSSPWEGPYRVVKRLSAVTYRIQRNRHSACKVVHFNRLWKIKGAPRFSWTSGSVERSSSRDAPSPEQDMGSSGTAGAGIFSNSDDAAPEVAPGSDARSESPTDPSQPLPDSQQPNAGARDSTSPAQHRRSQRRRGPPSYLLDYDCS